MANRRVRLLRRSVEVQAHYQKLGNVFFNFLQHILHILVRLFKDSYIAVLVVGDADGIIHYPFKILAPTSYVLHLKLPSSPARS